MRHLKSGRALGVKPAHRRAMMRNMVTSLLEHGQIKTTVARAKELRRPLDKMITLGKKGDLAARRSALTFVKSKEAMSQLFGELAERYAERPGGFSRIIRVGRRQGDGAEMALIQLVGSAKDPFPDSKKPAPRRRGRRAGAVQRDVQAKVTGDSAAAAAESTEDAAPAEKAEATVADAAEVTKAEGTSETEAAAASEAEGSADAEAGEPEAPAEQASDSASEEAAADDAAPEEKNK